MKKLILLFTVLAFIGCKEEVIDYDDITIVDNLAYFKHDMSLVTGTVKGWWYDTEQLAFEGNYKDGKAIGVNKSWYNNGRLKYEENHKNGKMDGIQKEWYSDGQLSVQRTYKYGELDGFVKRWFANGQLWYEENYKDGKRVSEKEWDEYGNRKE